MLFTTCSCKNCRIGTTAPLWFAGRSWSPPPSLAARPVRRAATAATTFLDLRLVGRRRTYAYSVSQTQATARRTSGQRSRGVSGNSCAFLRCSRQFNSSTVRGFLPAGGCIARPLESDGRFAGGETHRPQFEEAKSVVEMITPGGLGMQTFAHKVEPLCISNAQRKNVLRSHRPTASPPYSV